MWRRIAQLSPRERLLLAAASTWVLAARAALLPRGGSFPARRRALDALATHLPELPQPTLDEAMWAVSAAARRLPGTRCLAFALAMRGLLLQAGIDSELRIGVARDDAREDRSRAIKAHAWVRCGDRDLSWGDDVEGYGVLGTQGPP